MAILVSYDVEAASVGEAIAKIKDGSESYKESLEPESTGKALRIISDLHSKHEVPFTLFIVGKTLLQSVTPVKDAMSRLGSLVDIQQHTYSHVLFKDIVYTTKDERILYPAAPYELLEHEVESASDVFKRILNVQCKGIRTPYCYWNGLRGEKRLLKLLSDNGMKFVSSFGRNEMGGQPTPWVQPYTYVEDGFPELVELPIQNWFDVIWYDTYGWDKGGMESFKRLLRENVDYVHKNNLVWGVVFHEWVLVKNNEPKTGVVEDFLRYSRAKGEEMYTNLDYSEIFRKGS